MQTEHIALLIPILGIILGIGIAVVSIVTTHRERQKRVELRHRERLAAIEKGIELPLDPDPEGTGRKANPLRSGLVTLFIGILLYFALRVVADPGVALFGLIPAAYGAASLISYVVESRRNGNGAAPK